MTTKRELYKLLSECLSAIKNDNRNNYLFSRILKIMPHNNRPKLNVSTHSLANTLMEFINLHLEKEKWDEEMISDLLYKTCRLLNVQIQEDGTVLRLKLEDKTPMKAEESYFVEEDFE